jgi:hypothetical protein
MNRFILFLLLVLSVIGSQISAFALECPKMPEQSNKDWEVEVKAAVLKIGPVKGGELATRTRKATKDLLGKLPQAGNIYLEQMMYSSYCSALRDDTKIRESEKAKLLREYNREVRRALNPFTASPKKTEVKSPESVLRSKPEPQKKSSNTRNKKTLLDLFNNDFNYLLRSSSDINWAKPGNDKVIIKSQVYLDFQSQTMFLGFYIPYSPQTYEICAALTDYYGTVIEDQKKLEVKTWAPGTQPVDSSELRFSGRIFLYHEYFLREEQKRELFSLYKSKGVSLQFRDLEYLHAMNKER